MYYDNLTIAGLPVQPITVSGLTTRLSDEQSVKANGLTVTVADASRYWISAWRTLPAGETLSVRFESKSTVVFQGEVSEVTHSHVNKRAEISVVDTFSRVTKVAVDPLIWSRPAASPHAVTEVVMQGEEPSSWLIVDHVAGLWPGDKIRRVGADTEEMTIAVVNPEFNTILFTDKPGAHAKQGDIWERITHARRMVSFNNAMEMVAENMNAGEGVVLTFENKLPAHVDLDNRGTFATPLPELDQPGAVLLLTSAGSGDVLTLYRQPGGDAIVRHGLEVTQEVGPLPITGDNTPPLPLDWSRDLVEKPDVMLYPLRRHLTPGHVERPPLRESAKAKGHGDVSEGEPPGGTGEGGGGTGEGEEPVIIHAVETVDHSLATGWEISSDGPGGAWMLRRYYWDPDLVDWVETPSGAVAQLPTDPAARYRGLAFMHGQGWLFAIRHAGVEETTMATMEVISTTGQVLASTELEGGFLGYSLLSISIADVVVHLQDSRIAVVTSWSDGIFTHRQVVAPSGHEWMVGTAMVLDDSLFIISISKEGTFLSRWSLLDSWTLDWTEQLLPHGALQAVTVQSGGDLWIGAAGQLWRHSKRFIPVLPNADFDGSVSDIVRNMCLLADCYVVAGKTGTVSFLPRTWRQGQVEVVHTKGLKEKVGKHHQTVKVKGVGKHATATATTGKPGKTLQLECSSILTASHAAALAGLFLDRSKHAPASISTTLPYPYEHAPVPLAKLVLGGSPFVITEVQEPVLGETNPPIPRYEVKAVEDFQ